MTPPCPYCPGRMMKQDGRAPFGGQRFRCPACRRTRTDRTGTPVAGHRCPAEVSTTAVRWSFRDRLSLADVRDLLGERVPQRGVSRPIAAINSHLRAQPRPPQASP